MIEDNLMEYKEEIKRILKEIDINNKKIKMLLSDNYKINNRVAYEKEIDEIILYNKNLINKI